MYVQHLFWFVQTKWWSSQTYMYANANYLPAWRNKLLVHSFAEIRELHKVLQYFKLIDEMSLGAGAVKVEGPMVQKRSIALEVTMPTKRAPTIQHHHTGRVQWILTTTHTYLSRGGSSGSKNQQISQVENSNDPQRSAKKSRAEIQLFRESLSDKMHATTPKCIVGGLEFTIFQRHLEQWQERPWTYVCEC